jgi:5-formyltetrahydrofolate cyclo-ligase
MNPAKETLRREMRTRLRAMTPATHAEASLVICELAAKLPAFVQSRCIALFAPLSSEPDIHPLVEEAWARNKRVALPLMVRQGATPVLDWHEVTTWDDVVVSGTFGLGEPDPLRCPRVPIPQLDCVFVPGIGLFFSLQKVSRLYREPHDQPLPTILTEDGLFSCSGGL